MLSSVVLERRVLAYAARFLSTRARLRGFIERLLYRWRRAGGEVGVDEVEIGALIERCLARGYVDERRFAQSRLTRWHCAGNSQRVMVQKLRAEALDSSVIEAAMEEFREEHGEESLEREAAMHYARKRGLGPYRRQERGLWRQRDLARMGRRGFERDVVYWVIDHAEEGE